VVVELRLERTGDAGEDCPSVKIRKNDDLLSLPSVAVIGASGEKLGVMPSADGLRLAREQGLDLVEVNPKGKPPVCRILDMGRYTNEPGEKPSRRHPETTPRVFLVRAKLAVTGRAGAYLVGDLVTGGEIRAGMVAHLPVGPDAFRAVRIRAIEYVDHVADRTSQLGLQVVGETPEQVAAIQSLEGAQLVEITESAG
jgi:hypothetical protein